MIVRLKVFFNIYCALNSRGFNSMIVRLKDRPRHWRGGSHNSFQFYDSPIKSLFSRSLSSCFFRFQFYDSPIKRRRESVFRARIYRAFQFYDSPIKRKQKVCYFINFFFMFQFYDSPIKSFLFIFLPPSFTISFNSMIVRLKVVRNDKKHY